MNVDRHIWRVQLSKIYLHQIMRHIGYRISLAGHIFFSLANNNRDIQVACFWCLTLYIHGTTRTCTSPTTRRPNRVNDFGSFSAPRERRVGVRRSYVIDYTLSLGFKTFTLVSALRFHPIPVHSSFMYCSPHTFTDFMSPSPPKSLYRIVYEEGDG